MCGDAIVMFFGAYFLFDNTTHQHNGQALPQLPERMYHAFMQMLSSGPAWLSIIPPDHSHSLLPDVVKKVIWRHCGSTTTEPYRLLAVPAPVPSTIFMVVSDLQQNHQFLTQPSWR
ncbi:probable phospholipid-transporting ATPase IH isoform X5 [Lates japonicus]|uniref:Probable phospholipid-transporting ATPase IH isoform X5 n=1 Tax=Lates japonicus TaxID=270547 RepID=A0AAD3NEV1_LATJO|nr:probable phospholipid-transporting ATPase IH isoform X5 [Lates japonicus]